MDHILVEGVCVSPDHYIGGERITSSATFEDISPIDETLMGSVAAGGPAEVEAAVVAALKAFPAWAALGPQGWGQHWPRATPLCSSPLSGLRLPVLCWPIMRKRLAFHQESSILSRAWARMLGPRWWLTQASDASRLPVHLRLREALAKRQQKILLLWASNWVANRHL